MLSGIPDAHADRVQARHRRHLEVAQQFVDAGFDHLALLTAAPDPDGCFDFFTSTLAEPLQDLTPRS